MPGAFLCCRYQVPMDAERRWDICLRRLRSYGVCWTPLLTWGFAGAPHSNREDSTFGKTDVHRLLSVCTADWAAPFLSIEDTQCCHSPPTWKRNYGRRNPSEKTISMIKDKGGLKAGRCRSLGLAAHTIGALALAIAHNLKQTFRIERTQTQKPAPPARPKSHQPTRRNISADSLTPRAPPD